jgi:hypothetical protein
MKNYELSDEKAGLIVQALRTSACVSRQHGHILQADIFGNLAEEIDKKLYPNTGGLICGQGEEHE